MKTAIILLYITGYLWGAWEYFQAWKRGDEENLYG